MSTEDKMKRQCKKEHVYLKKGKCGKNMKTYLMLQNKYADWKHDSSTVVHCLCPIHFSEKNSTCRILLKLLKYIKLFHQQIKWDLLLNMYA